MPIPSQPTLRDYWRIISKRKKVVIITTIIVIAIALILTREKKEKAVYQTTARIVIEGALVQIQPRQGSELVSRGYRAAIDVVFLQTQYEIIKSAPVIERALKILGWETQDKDAAINRIKRSIIVGPSVGNKEVGGEGRGAIIYITSRDTNPRAAMEIANAMAEAYIELKQEERQNVIGNVYANLEKQVREAKAKLDAYEKNMEEYRKKEGLIILENKGDISSQTVQKINNQLIEVRAEIAQTETLLKTLKDLLPKDSLSALTLASEQLGQIRAINIGLKQKLLDTQNNFNAVLQMYKEKHPEVIRVRSELELVKQQIDQEVKGSIDSLTADIETKRNLEKTLVVFLERPDLGEKQKKYTELQREVDFNRRFYETLLSRLKEVDVIEQLGDVAEYKILEPASLPTSPLPTENKKGRLISPLIGLIFGLSLAFVLEYLDNTIKTIEDVETYLDMAVLGIIPHIPGAEKKKRVRIKNE